MDLSIETIDKYYCSDSIENGRIVKRFFNKLCNNIFKKTYMYYNYLGTNELSILFGERNIYSCIAAAIDEITPVHMSEFIFSKSSHKVSEKDRRVDFYCMHKYGNKGKKINYFIEVKKGWYCLNKRSKYELNKSIENGIRNLVDQISVIKKISPNWDGFYDVYLGIIIIHGYHNNGDDTYNCNDVLDNIYNLLDKRKNYQLISSTWTLPGDMGVNWKKDRCRFVTIQGIVGSKKKI